MQDLLKVIIVSFTFLIGTIITGFILFNDNDKTSEYQEASSSFGQLWQEHQKLP